MSWDYVNTKKQGDAGLGLAIGWFAAKGITVSIPLTDSQEYDLVVDVTGELDRCQVKSTYYKTPYGNYAVDLRIKGGNRTGTGKAKKLDRNSVDSVFIVTPEKYYWIPTSSFDNSSSITLASIYDEFIVFEKQKEVD